MTTTVLNTKVGEVDNKIPDVSGLVKKTGYNAKILDTEGKYFSTSDYNKFAGQILDAKSKQKNFTTKVISVLFKTFDLSFMVLKICLFINQHLQC